jgi:hypothetical protein
MVYIAKIGSQISRQYLSTRPDQFCSPIFVLFLFSFFIQNNNILDIIFNQHKYLHHFYCWTNAECRGLFCPVGFCRKPTKDADVSCYSSPLGTCIFSLQASGCNFSPKKIYVIKHALFKNLLYNKYMCCLCTCEKYEL